MVPLTGAEERALAAVDRTAIATALTELLAVPSVGGTDAEADVQHLLGKQLTRLGLDVDLWAMDLPALTADAGFPGAEVDRSEAWGLVGTARGSEDGADDVPALVLQGHVDVVPPGDLAKWGTEPVRADVARRPGARPRRVRHEGRRRREPGRAGGGPRLRRPAAAAASRRTSSSARRTAGSGAFGTLQRGPHRRRLHHHRADQRHPDHRRGRAR